MQKWNGLVFANIFDQANQFFGKYLSSLLDKAYAFAKTNMLIFAIVLLFLAITFLFGFFAMLIKARKLFFFLIIIIGLIVSIWWFFGRSKGSTLSISYYLDNLRLFNCYF